jgi:hypothetical protein
MSRADKRPIADRIREALQDGPRTYHDLMRDVFPPNDYEKSWRVSNRGGPPACARAFGSALRRLGIAYDSKPGERYYTIRLSKRDRP